MAGVATAIASGGPGAVFWMWLIGILGMATSFAEAVLAQIFREKQEDGTYVGGPTYYFSKGLGGKIGLPGRPALRTFITGKPASIGSVRITKHCSPFTG